MPSPFPLLLHGWPLSHSACAKNCLVVLNFLRIRWRASVHERVGTVHRPWRLTARVYANVYVHSLCIKHANFHQKFIYDVSYPIPRSVQFGTAVRNSMHIFINIIICKRIQFARHWGWIELSTFEIFHLFLQAATVRVFGESSIRNWIFMIANRMYFVCWLKSGKTMDYQFKCPVASRGDICSAQGRENCGSTGLH